MEHLLWVEKYRPQKVEDCILPDAIKSTFMEYVARKEIPNLLLSGTAGVGKTTIAKALCNEVGCDYIVINGSDESGIDVLRNKIKNYASSVSLAGGRKVVIIDEADYLNPNSKRVEWILEQEKVTYDKEVVAAVITKHFPDNRRILNELQRYSVAGTIDKGILSNIADIQLDALISSLKDKDFASTRKWVTTNLDNDPVKIYRKLYDTLYEVLKPASVPQLVLILAKYQYQAAFVADHEINMVACLTEIMVDCEFK